MAWLDEAKMYVRFTVALRDFLRRRITLAQARDIVRERLAARAATFLKIVDRSVFGNPRSPYLPLMKHAGCTPGDLHTLVERCGLEGALLHLRKAGVYVGFEEFKGRAPLVRGSLKMEVSPRSFDNPFLVTHFYAESGGSTGVRTRVPHDLDQYAALSPLTMLSRAAFDALDAPLAIWRSILPSGSGINNVLFAARYGQPPERWFSQLRAFESRNPKYTLATYFFCTAARLYGAAIPYPEHVPVEQAVVVARWAADAARRHGKSAVSATVSSSLRTSLAAQEHGLDLGGVTFLSGGEPLTPDKVRGIEKSGARIIPQYSMSEAGRIGNGCSRPIDCTDVHLASDAFAIVPHPRDVPGFDTTVPAFHLTTLLPSAPKILLNVETDDFGIVEQRSCGCLWDELGFTTHLRGIRSYRKLTGEGVTLVGGDMIHILEHELPARFGGSPIDYQLLEQEDDRGLTRMYLLISPRVVLADEHTVIPTVIDLLKRMSPGADFARSIWSQAGSLEIRRMEPFVSGHGKINPLHVLASGAARMKAMAAVAVLLAAMLSACGSSRPMPAPWAA